MNSLRLKSIMLMKGDTAARLAEHIGVSPQRFSAKINEKNGAEFTQSEIAKISARYELSALEISEIFFTKKVS